MINFPRKLKELREEKQLKQKDLANIINVSPSRISEWENGKKRPVYEDLINVAKFFEVSLDYLLGLEDEFGNKV